VEKRGVIEPGRTPPEKEQVPQQKTAEIDELDNDFRKRAADAARTASN
jgi:hypothetical protein